MTFAQVGDDAKGGVQGGRTASRGSPLDWIVALGQPLHSVVRKVDFAAEQST